MAALAAAIVLFAQAQAVDEKKIQELVEKCGSDEIEARETATRDLFAMGEAALPLLEKAAAAARGETKARLEKVVADLTLPARWVKDAVEGDWNQVYQKLDQAIRTKELDRPQLTRVLGALLLNEAVTPEQRQNVLQLVTNHRVREIWPSVVQLMIREETMYENYGSYLQRLRPPKEAAGPLLKAIPKLQNSNSAYQLLELARSLKPERAAVEECFTAIFEGDDANLKNNVSGLIQQGRFVVAFPTMLKWWRDFPAMRSYPLRESLLRTPPGDAVGDVVNLLKSPQPEDAAMAVEYIGRQRVLGAAAALAGAMEARPELKPQILQAFRSLRADDEIRKWIAGPGSPGRRAAIALAAELGLTSAAPEIARAISDEDPAVRREAVSAAGQLRIPEAADRLESLLKDGDGGVRRAALVSLAQLLRKDATKIVLAHLRSNDPDLLAAAVESLPNVDSEQALAALTTDEALGRPMTRHALAVLIVRGGAATLHRVMARVSGKLSADDLHAEIRLVQAVPGR